MKLLKIHYLYFFIYDLFKHKKNSNYLNRKSSYQILRTLYRLTNGFLTNLIGYILSSFKLNNPKTCLTPREIKTTTLFSLFGSRTYVRRQKT